jgi:hypothetical protein
MMGMVGRPGSNLMDSIAVATTVVSLLYLSLWVLASRIRIRRPRRPRPRLCPAPLSLIGLLFAAVPSAAARDRLPSFPRLRSPTPPWSEPDVFSPPHSSGRTGAEAELEEAELEEAELEEPAPRDSGRHASARHTDPVGHTYRVRPGDCLWSIATSWLNSQDAARVAGYWPRIYIANRSTIGLNPDLIHAGAILTMPSPPVGQPDR